MKRWMVAMLVAGLAGAWAECASGEGEGAAEAEERKGAREEFAAGERAYGKGEFVKAAEAFLAAADGAAREGLDADVARFNALVAAEKAGEEGMDVAKIIQQSTETTSDVGLQAQLHFNLGNVLYNKAKAAHDDAGEGSGAGFQEANEAWEEYCKAVLLDPTQEQYKQNCENGQALLELIKKEIEEQKINQPKDGDDKKEEDEDRDEDGLKKDPEGNQFMQDPDGDKKMEQEDGEETGEQEGQQQQGEASEGEEQQQQAQEGEPQEEMEEREAEALMDLMKDKEQAQRERLRVRLGRPVPVEKDW